MNSKYALIVAGGMGTRMNANVPKQFLELNGKPVIWHTIRSFQKAEPEAQIIVVIPETHQEYWETINKKYFKNSGIKMTFGGATRFESVRNGVDEISDKKAVVAIHDAVRPVISEEIIRNSFHVADLKGSAITAVSVKESIRRKKEDGGTESCDRRDFFMVQTPQTFRYSWLKLAYGQKYRPDFTDDASVVEKMGGPINMIEGDYRNIKITTPEDLEVAALFLK